MTITVTIEELRAYEAAQDKWLIQRTGFLQQIVSDNHDISRMGRMNEFYIRQMTDWDAKNPRPTLIPKV
jgi:hypothetical protein